MKLTIESASMTQSEEEGYQGRVIFAVEGHKQPYEMTLYSKKGKTWEYSLHFSPGIGAGRRDPGSRDRLGGG